MKCYYNFHFQSTNSSTRFMTSLAHVGPTETQRNTNKGLVPSGVPFVLVGTSQLVLISDFGRNISLRLMARIYFSRCTTIRPTRLMLMGLFQLTPAIGTGIRQFFIFLTLVVPCASFVG